MSFTPWPDHPVLNERLERLQHNLLSWSTHESGELNRVLQRLFERPGKHLRGGFCILASWFTNKNPEAVLKAATAIEAFHLATLIHDDIIDGGRFRRGIPSLHRAYGLKEAVLMGDYLYSKALTEIAPLLSKGDELKLSKVLLQICRQEIQQSLNGKANWSLREHKRRTAGKTAMLFSLALHCGSVISEASEMTVQSLRRFGYNLGMAFQFIDDVLDYSPLSAIGKPPYQDIKNGLTNLPMIICRNELSTKDALRLENHLKRGKKRSIERFIHGSDSLNKAKLLATSYTQRAENELRLLGDSEVVRIFELTLHNCLTRNF